MQQNRHHDTGVTLHVMNLPVSRVPCLQLEPTWESDELRTAELEFLSHVFNFISTEELQNVRSRPGLIFPTLLNPSCMDKISCSCDRLLMLQDLIFSFVYLYSSHCRDIYLFTRVGKSWCPQGLVAVKMFPLVVSTPRR